MKNILIITFILSSLLANSKVNNDSLIINRLDKIEQSINNLRDSKSDKVDLNERINNQQALNEQTLTSISTQLDSASYNITIFGFLFSIAALLLGIYFTYLERKMVKISEQNKDFLRESKQIKEDVDSVNELIKSDLFNLFLKIKREETVHILDRLIQVPKDITNIVGSLLSRELLPEDFSKIRAAYIKLNPDDSDYKIKYKIVFFQHFFSESLKDEFLKDEISGVIDQLIHEAFENDMIKTTKDFTSVLSEVGLLKYKAEINKYFKGLSESEHKDFEDVYTIFFSKIKSRKSKFEFYNLIEDTKENRYAKIKFGQLLIDAYENLDPSEEEKAVFKELESIKSIQHKELEDIENKKEEELKKQEEKKKIAEERRKKQEEDKAKQEAIKKAQEEDKNPDNNK